MKKFYTLALAAVGSFGLMAQTTVIDTVETAFLKKNIEGYIEQANSFNGFLVHNEVTNAVNPGDYQQNYAAVTMNTNEAATFNGIIIDAYSLKMDGSPSNLDVVLWDKGFNYLGHETFTIPSDSYTHNLAFTTPVATMDTFYVEFYPNAATDSVVMYSNGDLDKLSGIVANPFENTSFLWVINYDANDSYVSVDGLYNLEANNSDFAVSPILEFVINDNSSVDLACNDAANLTANFTFGVNGHVHNPNLNNNAFGAYYFAGDKSSEVHFNTIEVVELMDRDTADVLNGTALAYTFPAAADYTVNANTHYQSISVYYAPKNFVATTTLNIAECAASSINENNILVAAYPNPATDVLNVSLNTNEAAAINVFDLTGKSVKSVKVNGLNAAINVSNLNNGLYTYQVLNANNEVLATSKFNVSK